MVVVKILVNSELTEKEFGVQAYENNSDGVCGVQDDFHCIAEVDGRDTIFGTNDENITVKIPLARILAEQVVDDLCSRGTGNTYDDDLALEYAQNRMNEFTCKVADLADAIMIDKYTTRDGLTIIGGDLVHCPHKCGECINEPDDCMHGCHDCGYFDGGNCIHSGSPNCGCLDDYCACDCSEWNDGRY